MVSCDTGDQLSTHMHYGKMNMLSVGLKEGSEFCKILHLYKDIKVDPEPSTSQISQASVNDSVNPPPVKMISLEELEQAMLGIAGKSMNR